MLANKSTHVYQVVRNVAVRLWSCWLWLPNDRCRSSCELFSVWAEVNAEILNWAWFKKLKILWKLLQRRLWAAVSRKIGFLIVWSLQSMIKSWTECTTVVNWKNKLKEAVHPIDDKTMNFACIHVFSSMHRKRCIQYVICFSWPCTLLSCLMCDGRKGFVMQINCNLHKFMNLTGCLCGPHFFSLRMRGVYGNS